MKRLMNSLGIFIALLAITSPAQAGSYSFVIGGHRFHVEAARSCRSTSCVSMSSSRGIRPTEDVDATPVRPSAPAPVQAVAPACPAAPVRPPQATVVVAPPPPPPPPALVVAATTSQPVVLPPAPRLEPPKLEPPRIDPPKAASFDPPRMDPPVAPRLETRPETRPEIKQSITISQRNDDEPADAPLGQWESAGAKGMVRIERCGPALCGYALTEASAKGESVLVNMKPKSDGVWTGNIYSRSSGNTYYATMTLKGSGKLHVEACVLGHFFCSGNDWIRVEERRERLITTSRQWSARS